MFVLSDVLRLFSALSEANHFPNSKLLISTSHNLRDINSFQYKNHNNNKLNKYKLSSALSGSLLN